MNEARKKKADPALLLQRTCRVLIVAGLLALAGCMGDAGGIVDEDPIRGGTRIPGNAPTTIGARGAAPSGPSEGAAPQLPPANASPVPAALAVGALTEGRDPRTAEDAGVKFGAPRVTPDANHLVPQAATGGGGTILPAGAATVAPGALAQSSYEQLQQMLLARGVAWQQLKTGVTKDEWVFACGIPHPRESNMEQQYEARAVGLGGLGAIRAVIQEIDKGAAAQ